MSNVLISELTSMTFLDALTSALQFTGNYNHLDQVSPAAILWPDRGREWESLIPRLRERLSVLTFGPHASEAASGSIAWLRCMVARTLPDCPPADALPIIYLPGVSVEVIRHAARRPK